MRDNEQRKWLFTSQWAAILENRPISSTTENETSLCAIIGKFRGRRKNNAPYVILSHNLIVSEVSEYKMVYKSQQNKPIINIISKKTR